MKIQSRVQGTVLSVLTLMGVGLAIGQDAASVDPVRAVLAQGEVRYVQPGDSGSSPRRATRARASLSSLTNAALNRYAPHFGIEDPATELRVLRSTAHGTTTVIRYRQLHGGLPVIGGELVMSLDLTGEVKSLSGETARQLALGTQEPVTTAAQATATALAAVSKYYSVERGDLEGSKPELWVYDPGLIGPDTARGASLVWRIEVSSRGPLTVRELVLIDATNGGLLLHFNQIEEALRQATYTANGGSTLPGSLLCDENQPLCTNGLNPDADLAHRHGRDTYNFYLDHHGRDSFDNLGATLQSTVNFAPPNYCPNASWDGTRMRYCPGAPAADDVVAHELTHAVTSNSSALLYLYESGAINESLSDLWGEFVDLTNGSGNDGSAVRWTMGEDFTGVGAVRNMLNPPQFGQPDRMRSPLYWTSSADNGGVHRNSGINNKAVSLMVDGGHFNGYTVSGIGIDKVAALYYRVQTQHLTPGSDHADLFLALNQACRNMIGGSDGVSTIDCQQVANATNAVEMNLPPTINVGAEAAVCPVNQLPQDVFFESAETSQDRARWVASRLTGTQGSWFIGLFGTAGPIAFVTPGVNAVSNYALAMGQSVIVPANGLLHFRHLFLQEYAGTNYYDGGILEYSTDEGVTWVNAGPLYSAGRNYNGTIATTGAGNPAEGQAAFVGDSRGYVSTRYDLASLAGQPLRVRFRNTSDDSVSTGLAWAFDELRVYSCGTNAAGNLSPTANAGADQSVSPAAAVSLDGSASSDTDGQITSVQWTQISGTQVTLNPVGTSVNFAAPLVPVEETLTFRLTVTDDRGAVSTADEVAVRVVNQQPLANAGADQARKPRESVLLQGSASDSDGTIASYRWSQVAGPPVALGTVLNMAFGNQHPQELWISNGPLAVGTTIANFLFSPNALANTGGTVSLQAGSYVRTCNTVSLTSCIPTVSFAVTGSVSAPVTSASNLPRTWTLQGVQLSDGTQVTGSFVFDAITFALSNIQIVANGNASSAIRFIAPSVAASAALTFRLTSTDNAGGSGADDITVTVTNLPPAVNAGVDKAAKPRDVVQLPGSASDTDGGLAGVAWTQVSGPAVTLASSATSTASFVAPSIAASAALVFRMTATDIDGGVTSDDVTVNVTNQQPTVDAGLDKSSKPRLMVPLQALASDPDGTIVSVVWSQQSGPAAALPNATLSSTSVIAPSVVANGTIVFRVTVTDNDGATAVDQISIALANTAPTATAGADKAANAGQNVSLAASGNDADGVISGYSWSQTGGPAVSLSGASTANAEFKAPSADTASTLTFQLTATDNDGATAVDSVAVSVAANPAGGGGGGGGGGQLDAWILAVLLGLVASRVMSRSAKPFRPLRHPRCWAAASVHAHRTRCP